MLERLSPLFEDKEVDSSSTGFLSLPDIKLGSSEPRSIPQNGLSKYGNEIY
jgi:hypothetical protein